MPKLDHTWVTIEGKSKMSIRRSADLEGYLDDTDEYEIEMDELLKRDTHKKRKSQKAGRQVSWRAIEDYLDDRKLRRQISEYYED